MTESTQPTATIVRTIELDTLGTVHGVTCDAQGNVWFAHGDAGGVACVEPSSGRIVRTLDAIHGKSGTAFDGEKLWQICEDAIVRFDPETGAIERSIQKPAGVHCSGMAWGEGALWIGDYDAKRIHKIDPETGAILKSLESDRLVTGVTWLGDALWHGAWQSKDAPYGATLRRIDADSGAVQREATLPGGVSLSGLGTDGRRLWCGGGFAGGLFAVDVPEPR